MRLPQVPRYTFGAALYDVLSFERPIYRGGRMQAIEQLQLGEGDVVLDVGCGTGLNFAPLLDRIGETGHVVGIDASEPMLAQARRKMESTDQVTLVHGDAAQLDELVDGRTFDAVLITYALSIVSNWRSAWTAARAVTRPGGRLAVVDLALPTGIGRLLEPAARLACFTGGVDLDRRPWTLVESQLDDVATTSCWSGHVVVAVGTNPTSSPMA